MTTRTFETGATRNGNKGKYEFDKYVNPINELSYAQYMKSHQVINWEYRPWDNRQKGIPFDSLFESAYRHMQTLCLLYQWYDVYEIEENGEFDWIVVDWGEPVEWGSNVHKKDFIEQLNAIRFNTEAMKLQYLTSNIIGNGEHWHKQEMEGREEDGEVSYEEYRIKKPKKVKSKK